MNTILITIFLIYALERSLTILYFLQVKEYRRDRVYSALKEEGFFSHLYGSPPRLPAKTARNILMTSIIVACVFGAAWLFSTVPWYGRLVLFVLAPCLSFAFAAIGVWLTAPYAFMKKRRIMHLASLRLAKTKTQVVGITGSYGKSTAKEWLYALLEDTYPTVRTRENQNTPYGIAENIIRQVTPATRFFIAEIGAYRKGEIREVCDFIHPAYGIVMPLGNQHLSLFGSPGNLARAKKELVDSLPGNGIAYVNKKDLAVLGTGAQATIRTYSVDQQADIALTSTSSSHTIRYAGKVITFTSMLPATYLTNILPVVALALDLGVSQETIKSKLEDLALPQDKLVLHKGKQGHALITDVYSSNVDGFIAALSFLRNHPSPKKIIVTRGIIELGQERKTSYEKIGKEISGFPCMLYTTDKVLAKSVPWDRAILVRNERILLDRTRSALTPETVILLEGRFSPSFVRHLL